jgi:hypothetical protein
MLGVCAHFSFVRAYFFSKGKPPSVILAERRSISASQLQLRTEGGVDTRKFERGALLCSQRFRDAGTSLDADHRFDRVQMINNWPIAATFEGEFSNVIASRAGKRGCGIGGERRLPLPVAKAST